MQSISLSWAWGIDCLSLHEIPSLCLPLIPTCTGHTSGCGLKVTTLDSEGKDDQILLRRPVGTLLLSLWPWRRFLTVGRTNSSKACRPSTVRIHQSLSSCWSLCVLRQRSWGIRVILGSETGNSAKLRNAERQGPHESCQKSVWDVRRMCVCGLWVVWCVVLGFQKECQSIFRFSGSNEFLEFIWFFCWIGLQLLRAMSGSAVGKPGPP